MVKKMFLYGIPFLYACTIFSMEAPGKPDIRTRGQFRALRFDDKGYTQLHRLVSKGDVEGVKKLLSKKVNPDIRSRDSFGMTPLIIAIGRGNLLLVKELIKAGADVNIDASRLDSDTTPLIFAITHGHDAIAYELIGANADVNRTRQGRISPLIIAIEKDNYNIAKALLEKGARANDVRDIDYASPLHFAANKSNSQMVELLIQHGADTQLKMRDGKIPADLTSDAKIKRLLEYE